MDWNKEIIKLNGICPICGLPVMQYGTAQLAHRIANTKENQKKYGTFFVNHSLNLVPVCSLKCNDACNIGHNPVEILKLLADIIIQEMRRQNEY